MRIDVLTLFPGMFQGPTNESIIKRAKDKGLFSLYIHNLREFTEDRHRTCDDKPFGGGPGMVMKPEPIFKAVDHIVSELKAKNAKIILLTPQGKKFNQKMAKGLSESPHLILICGHYEGVDERVRRFLATDEISIGDYITSGGELPAMVLVDCIVRLIPGVLGDERSAITESFEDNLLEHPQYTRPATFRGMRVPSELLSGNHQAIYKWKEKEALKRTRKRRPDLLR